MNTAEFQFTHAEAKRETLDRNYFRYKYKSLTFESSHTEKGQFKEQVHKSWAQDGFYYIGSPLSSDNEEYFDYENHDDIYDDDNLDEFLEEETEMFNELDE